MKIFREVDLIGADAQIDEATLVFSIMTEIKPCSHGNTGRHIIEGTIVDTWMTGNGPSEKAGFSYQMCEGTP